MEPTLDWICLSAFSFASRLKSFPIEFRGRDSQNRIPPRIWKAKNVFLLHKALLTKLMRLGLTNRIVDDLDSKPVYFDRRLLSNSKSNDKSESTISISI